MNWLLTDGPTWAQTAAIAAPLYVYGLWTVIDRGRALQRAQEAEHTANDALDLADDAIAWCQQVHDVLHRPESRLDAPATDYRPDDTNPIILTPQNGAEGVGRVHTQPQPTTHGATAYGRHRKPR